MERIKKFFAISVAVALFVAQSALGGTAFAATPAQTTVTASAASTLSATASATAAQSGSETMSATDAVELNNLINQNENLSYSDLGVSQPSLLPGNPFYFLKGWWQGVQLFFAFNPQAKAQLLLSDSNEHLAEIKALAAQNAAPTALQQAVNNYDSSWQSLESQVAALQTQQNSPASAVLLSQISSTLLKQQKLFDYLSAQVASNQNAAQSLNAAQKAALQYYGSVVTGFSSGAVVNALNAAAADQPGTGAFKNLKNIEVLMKVFNNVPAQAQPAIENVLLNHINQTANQIATLNANQLHLLQQFAVAGNGDLVNKLEALNLLKQQSLNPNLQTTVSAAIVGAQQSAAQNPTLVANTVQNSFAGCNFNALVVLKDIAQQQQNKTLAAEVDVAYNTCLNKVKTQVENNFQNVAQTFNNPSVIKNTTTLSVLQDLSNCQNNNSCKTLVDNLSLDTVNHFTTLMSSAAAVSRTDAQDAVESISNASPENLKTLQLLLPKLPPQAQSVIERVINQQTQNISTQIDNENSASELQNMQTEVEQNDLQDTAIAQQLQQKLKEVQQEQQQKQAELQQEQQQRQQELQMEQQQRAQAQQHQQGDQNNVVTPPAPQQTVPSANAPLQRYPLPPVQNGTASSAAASTQTQMPSQTSGDVGGDHGSSNSSRGTDN